MDSEVRWAMRVLKVYGTLKLRGKVNWRRRGVMKGEAHGRSEASPRRGDANGEWAWLLRDDAWGGGKRSLPGKLVCDRQKRFGPLWVFEREENRKANAEPEDEGEGHLTAARGKLLPIRVV
jgi:hypothetical protein